MVTSIAMIVAAPLGLGAAAYLSEYETGHAPKLKPILETLAGVPSVVIGFFALTVINPIVVQDLFGATNTFTMMAAGIGVGILTIPSWRRWPRTRCSRAAALREAAYGIGARRRTVTMSCSRRRSRGSRPLDPGYLPSARRDDGGGDRRRSDRQRRGR